MSADTQRQRQLQEELLSSQEVAGQLKRRVDTALALLAPSGTATPAAAPTAPAATSYGVDLGHSTLMFRCKHLGVSYQWGRFDKFGGSFTLADDPAASMVEMTIDAASVNSNSAGRDDHRARFDGQLHRSLASVLQADRADAAPFAQHQVAHRDLLLEQLAQVLARQLGLELCVALRGRIDELLPDEAPLDHALGSSVEEGQVTTDLHQHVAVADVGAEEGGGRSGGDPVAPHPGLAVRIDRHHPGAAAPRLLRREALRNPKSIYARHHGSCIPCL